MKITKERLKSWLSLIFAIFIALVIRTVVFEPYSIPSGSMKPNFLVGDYLFVSKYQYGISNASLPFEPNIFKGRLFVKGEPERGDVIVFKSSASRITNYIKRLIGKPGDEIQLKNGVVYINGQALLRKEAGNFIDTDGTIYSRYIETLPNGVSYYILQKTLEAPWNNTDVIKVPENHYFFLGDNRDGSLDSRFSTPIGFVPYDKLIGKAEVIMFSNPESIFYIWNWVFSFDKSRFLLRVKSL